MMKRIVSAILVLAFLGFQAGCYSTYTISKDELDKLESGNEAVDVTIQSQEGDAVKVSPETPLEVCCDGEEVVRVTPYNFLLSDTQLVAPDYDLLMSVEQVEYAEVREISYWKTFGLVGAIVVGVGGGFAALALTQ